MEVQFRYQPTNTLIKCEVDPGLTVRVVIKEMLQPAIYSKKSLFSFFPLQLLYNGEEMDLENTFGSSNYLPGTEVLVRIVDSYPNTEDDYNIGTYALFSRALLKQDIKEVCSILSSKEQIPDIFCTLLKVLTASITERFFFSEQLVPTTENDHFSLISVICDWLRMYGGERLIEYNSVISNILLLVGAIFKEIPITSFSEQEILDIWHGVFYVLDSALFTYSINDGNESGDYPSYSTYIDELLRIKPQLDEASESYLRNTVEMVVFLFSHFFQCPCVLKEFQNPYFYKTVYRLLELYCDSQFIMGMFFYQFGCAMNRTYDLGLPSLWNTPLSLKVAEVIMREMTRYVDFSLNNRDSVDLIDITGKQIPFTTCYTYCLGVICSFMSDELEKVMIDTDFIDNLKKSINAFCIFYSSQEDSKGEDALEFKNAFICYLRLICILTYDYKACMLLMNSDLEKEKETEEEEGNRFFITALCTFMKKTWDDSVAVLLFSHIMRNLSSYQRLGKFMSIHNSWYSYLYVLFNYEKTLADENQSEFVPDRVPFIQRETELEGGSYTLSMSLLNNLLRCIINLSVSYPSFVKVVVESEGWTSGELLSFMINVPSNTSLAITTMLFIQTIVTHYSEFDRTVIQAVLNHAFESIEKEHDDLEQQRDQISEQRYNAYSILYEQAIDIAAKLDPFIARNEDQDWDKIQCTPISDNEISVLFYSVPLDLYSLRIHFDDMKESLLCCHIYNAPEEKAPNLEEDIPYDVFLPVGLPSIIFDAIFYDSTILRVEYEGNVLSEDSPVNCDEEREVTIILISPSFNMDTLTTSVSSIRHSMVYPPTITATLHNPLNEMNPDILLRTTGTNKGQERKAIGEEDEYVTVNEERIASRQRRNQLEEDHIEKQEEDRDSIDISLEQIPTIYPESSVLEKPSSLPPVDLEETEEVDDVLKPLGVEIGKPHDTMKGTLRNTLRSYATMYSTMKGETLSAEMFKISVRNIDQEQIFKPSIIISQVFDDEKSSKLRIKRMMKNLKVDSENDTHSMIILDYVREGGLSRYWYVLQSIAQDLSNFSVDDYIMVMEGCVESLPAALKSSSLESVKNDLFLVYHYLNECCGYGIEAVMYDLITYQCNALIEGLIEFHHLCYGCNENDYLSECIDCILSIFQNIVINQELIKKCLECHVMELFADILHRQMITSVTASQQLLSLISIMGKFFRVCDAEHREIVQKEIKVIIDFVQDPTCLRRLNRLLK